jgi:2-(1,2-epoxy-1,2-dihydrophenyl)acetyl-CoA isomerase
MSDSVLYEVSDGVATLTLNRPDAMNALDTATKDALREAVGQASADPSARVVVLTGAGRAFGVGQDLKEHIQNLEKLADDPGAVWNTVAEHYNPITLTLATMAKPVIAAVNGVAAGASAGFAFACDFRILTEQAGFNLAFTGIGLTADSGASWTLPRLVGHAKATELLMLPRTINASEALELGLATRVVPADEFRATVNDLATRLAAGPTLAYGAVRQSLAFAASSTLAESLEKESQLQTMVGASADHREAVAAFIGKRKPVFRGV